MHKQCHHTTCHSRNCWSISRHHPWCTSTAKHSMPNHQFIDSNSSTCWCNFLHSVAVIQHVAGLTTGHRSEVWHISIWSWDITGRIHSRSMAHHSLMIMQVSTIHVLICSFISRYFNISEIDIPCITDTTDCFPRTWPVPSCQICVNVTAGNFSFCWFNYCISHILVHSEIITVSYIWTIQNPDFMKAHRNSKDDQRMNKWFHIRLRPLHHCTDGSPVLRYPC